MAQKIISFTDADSGELVHIGASQVLCLLDKGGVKTVTYLQNGIVKDLGFSLPATLAAASTEAGNTVLITVEGDGAKSDTITVSTATNAELYSFDIEGITFSYTASGSATKDEITAGLKASYDANPISGIRISDDGVDTLTITGSFGEPYVLSALVGTTLATANVSSVTGTNVYVNADRISALVDGPTGAGGALGDYMLYDAGGATLKTINMLQSVEAVETAVDAL